MMVQQHKPTVLVIGAGPAGLATSIFAAHRGLKVCVADQRRPLIDKACGEGLLPDTVAAASSLGLQFSDGEGFPFTGIRFLDITGPTVEARFPAAPGFGIRRTALHAKLLQCAVDAGVSFAWNTRIAHAGPDGVVYNGTRVPFDWVVGADGENSQIRNSVCPRTLNYEKTRFGRRRH